MGINDHSYLAKENDLAWMMPANFMTSWWWVKFCPKEHCRSWHKGPICSLMEKQHGIQLWHSIPKGYNDGLPLAQCGILFCEKKTFSLGIPDGKLSRTMWHKYLIHIYMSLKLEFFSAKLLYRIMLYYLKNVGFLWDILAWFSRVCSLYH